MITENKSQSTPKNLKKKTTLINQLKQEDNKKKDPLKNFKLSKCIHLWLIKNWYPLGKC